MGVLAVQGQYDLSALTCLLKIGDAQHTPDSQQIMELLWYIMLFLYYMSQWSKIDSTMAFAVWHVPVAFYIGMLAFLRITFMFHVARIWEGTSFVVFLSL